MAGCWERFVCRASEPLHCSALLMSFSTLFQLLDCTSRRCQSFYFADLHVCFCVAVMTCILASFTSARPAATSLRCRRRCPTLRCIWRTPWGRCSSKPCVRGRRQVRRTECRGEQDAAGPHACCCSKPAILCLVLSSVPGLMHGTCKCAPSHRSLLAGQSRAVKVMYEQLLPTAQHAGIPPMQASCWGGSAGIGERLRS